MAKRKNQPTEEQLIRELRRKGDYTCVNISMPRIPEKITEPQFFGISNAEIARLLTDKNSKIDKLSNELKEARAEIKRLQALLEESEGPCICIAP